MITFLVIWFFVSLLAAGWILAALFLAAQTPTSNAECGVRSAEQKVFNHRGTEAQRGNKSASERPTFVITSRSVPLCLCGKTPLFKTRRAELETRKPGGKQP